ncbi:unnamed protein product [Cyprideis torosa]|uniref:Uncharacterized protein n=1 Tax=Cyprideis torosa TaxID=163714 RepID=A0A7R8WRI8_9CRUS|nr:unnamed protein product [Cyprideis torosa]CAG0902633.1 unnamed protein product [Cyprideis torosa]
MRNGQAIDLPRVHGWRAGAGAGAEGGGCPAPAQSSTSATTSELLVRDIESSADDEADSLQAGAKDAESKNSLWYRDSGNGPEIVFSDGTSVVYHWQKYGEINLPLLQANAPALLHATLLDEEAVKGNSTRWRHKQPVITCQNGRFKSGMDPVIDM